MRSRGTLYEWGDISPTSSARGGRRIDCRVKVSLDYIMRISQTKQNHSMFWMPTEQLTSYQALVSVIDIQDKAKREEESVHPAEVLHALPQWSEWGTAPEPTLETGACGVFLTFWLLAAKIHPRFFFCFVLSFPSVSTSVPFFFQLEHFKSNSCSFLHSHPSAKSKTCYVALFFFSPPPTFGKVVFPSRGIAYYCPGDIRTIHPQYMTQGLRFTEPASSLSLS